MVRAAQNVFDPEHNEASRRLVPWRIKRHAAGPPVINIARLGSSRVCSE
jgi:hypothetical protein